MRLLKQGAVDATGDQTEQTRVFDIVRGAKWPAHFPGRVVKNGFFARWHGREDELQSVWPDEEKQYVASSPTDLGTRVLWAGEGVDVVKDVHPAAEIIERVIEEAVAALRGGVRMLG